MRSLCQQLQLPILPFPICQHLSLAPLVYLMGTHPQGGSYCQLMGVGLGQQEFSSNLFHVLSVMQPLLHQRGLHLLVWELLCSKPGPLSPCWAWTPCCFTKHARTCRRRICRTRKGIWLIWPL